MSNPTIHLTRVFRPVSKLMSLLLAAGLVSCCRIPAGRQESTLFQVSTIAALMDGCYDGVMSCCELRQKGDFGIGTFDRLDGEMILIDGTFFQMRADGVVLPAADSMRVPFASVTRFRPGASCALTNVTTFECLKTRLDQLRTSDNQFFAFRVDGLFDHVKYRSVPAQAKPYPKLVTVAARQPVFERQFIRGSLIGFWCPEHANSLNVPGYHLHFISDDRKRGGHLLDCALQKGVGRAGRLTTFTLSLPQTESFDHFQKGSTHLQSLKAVESGK